jgi:hypothetical protein
MSMISCDACSETISADAKACPKCGHPVSRPPAVFRWLLIGSLVLLCVAIAYTIDRAVVTSARESEIERAKGVDVIQALYSYNDVQKQRDHGLAISGALVPLVIVLYLFRRREARVQAALAIGRSGGTS